MSKYLPSHITDAHVYLNHDGLPMMTAMWNGKPWLFYWKDNPPTWVSHMDMNNKSSMWDAMHSPLWQQRWLPEDRADMYHRLAFTQAVQP